MAVQNEIKEQGQEQEQEQEQGQGQGQNQGQYVNIREVPGSCGRLFVGCVANEQKIEGRVHFYYLVPDGKGGYRLPTDEEMDEILIKYMRNIEGK